MDLRSGDSVTVVSKWTRKVYAQKHPRPSRWRDKGLERDENYGTIPDGTLCLYMGSERVSHLRPGSPPSEISWLLYHLLMWGTRLIWVNNEVCTLTRVER